jgi:hypothetical protein
VKPQRDYEAEVYAGAPLDGDIAKERGFDKGLVSMVFEKQRRATFRIGQARIRRIVRLAAEDRGLVAAVAGAKVVARPPRERVDVLDTDDGVVVVDTTSENGGLFTTSDVYVFARGASLEQRVGALQAVAPAAAKRVREALVAAEWTR